MGSCRPTTSIRELRLVYLANKDRDAIIKLLLSEEGREQE